jgi:hypothetical protein
VSDGTTFTKRFSDLGATLCWRAAQSFACVPSWQPGPTLLYSDRDAVQHTVRGIAITSGLAGMLGKLAVTLFAWRLVVPKEPLGALAASIAGWADPRIKRTKRNKCWMRKE